MERKIEVHAYHGWGFDARFWDPLKLELPEHIIFKSADRGYFGGEFLPKFESESSEKVLFLHSFGLHWSLLEIKEIADIIIVFNGFDAFLSLERTAKLRSKKVLNSMIEQFEKDPEIVLKAFYKNCFGQSDPVIPNLSLLDRSLLLNDLKSLSNIKLELTDKIEADWFVIDSGKDRIVPGGRGQELLAYFGTQKYLKVDEGVHALPIDNPKECIKILSEAFPIFDTK